MEVRGCSRPIIVVVLVVAGCLVALVANLAVWSHRELLDTDRFVAALAPLAEDPDVIDGVADELTGRIVKVVPGAPQTVVDEALRHVLELPQFETIWNAAVRDAHRELLDLADSGEEVGLDLDEVLRRVDRSLEARGIDLLDQATIEEIDEIVPWHSDYLRQTVRGIRIIERGTLVLPPLAAGMFVAAVVLADERRGVVGRIGLGVAGAMVVTVLALWMARAVGTRRIHNETAERAAGDVWDRIFTSLYWQTGVVCTVALGVAAGAWLLRHRE